MKNKQLKEIPTAYFINEFALRAQVDFGNAREWLIFLYLVAQLDPKNQGELTDAIVSIQDLEKVLKTSGNKWGGLYSEVRDCARRMAKVTCEFDSDVVINGEKLPRIRTIFSSIDPIQTSEGATFIKYCFNEKMKPLLLGFKNNFLGIKPPVGMKSGHALRFLLLCKAERDRKRKYERTTALSYEVNELKKLLAISANQYKDRIDNFKRRVIEPMVEGVNASGIIKVVNYQPKRTGRRITHFEFEVGDGVDYKPPKAFLELPNSVEEKEKITKKDNPPTKKELAQLTKSQIAAYDFLRKKKIYGGIAYREIIPKMPSSEFKGYEDFFCEEAYNVVAEKSVATNTEDKAAVFVKWFKQDIFKTDQFPRIIEAVVSRRKALPDEAQSNRRIAATMTHQEFVSWYRDLDKN